ncbi:MAG: hypothetical protein ACE5GO_07630, partial [Anaerolineales bacterium]
TRIERLTREILEYARPSEPDLRAENINDLIESCLQGIMLSQLGKPYIGMYNHIMLSFVTTHQ